jgi:hypothetical protein
MVRPFCSESRQAFPLFIAPLLMSSNARLLSSSSRAALPMTLEQAKTGASSKNSALPCCSEHSLPPYAQDSP